MKQPPGQAGSLESDVQALCIEMIHTVRDQRRPDHVATVIQRHGFDHVIDHLTGRIVGEMAVVAYCRGNEASAVFEEFFAPVKERAPEIAESLWHWVLDSRHPQIGDPGNQELFVIFLLGMHFMNACELAAGRSPDGQPHRRCSPLCASSTWRVIARRSFRRTRTRRPSGGSA